VVSIALSSLTSLDVHQNCWIARPIGASSRLPRGRQPLGVFGLIASGSLAARITRANGPRTEEYSYLPELFEALGQPQAKANGAPGQRYRCPIRFDRLIAGAQL